MTRLRADQAGLVIMDRWVTRLRAGQAGLVKHGQMVDQAEGRSSRAGHAGGLVSQDR